MIKKWFVLTGGLIVVFSLFLLLGLNHGNEYFAYANEEFIIEQEQIIVDYDNSVVPYDSAIETVDSVEQNIITQFKWRDDSNIDHPLSYTRIDVFNAGMINVYYTDIDGRLPAECTVSSTEDLTLIVYACGSNTMVGEASNEDIIPWSMNLSNFDINTPDCVFIPSNSYSDFSKAQQISQALIFANRFAEEMYGQSLSNVTAIYPHDGISKYASSEKNIYISSVETDLDYSDWDVIMHEYGHHVSYEMGIINSPGGDHSSSVNDADARNNKSEGIRLAWAESWPTIFGELAQQYFASSLVNISHVADGAYTDQINYAYESIALSLGEACERSIMAVLWDLYDDSITESNDTIALGYQAWWDVTTGSGATTFCEFITYFYEVYPEYKDDIGKNLSKYGMATSQPEVLNGNSVLTATPPTFNWSAQGGSVKYPNNGFSLQVFNEDMTNVETAAMTTNTTITLTEQNWNTVLSWTGEKIYITIVSMQLHEPVTGGYYSEFVEFTKPLFSTSATTGGVIITGTYCTWEDTLQIPEKIHGETVVGIGDWAFSGATMTTLAFENYNTVTTLGTGAFSDCPNLAWITLPNNITSTGDWTFSNAYEGGSFFTYTGSTLTHIGVGAFSETNLPASSKIPESVTHIGNWAYYMTTFNNDFRLMPNNQLTSIGEYAFYKAHLIDVTISSQVTSVGASAFGDCDCESCKPTDGTTGIVGPTLYVAHSSRPSGWASNWNSYNCPVVWGATLSTDNSYVVSVNKTSASISNSNAIGGVGNPYREDYTFDGWYTTSDFSGTSYTDITQAPNGTLYAKWTESSCIAEGTLITLANGSQVAVENLTGNEELLVWNMLTGSYDTAPILFIDSDPLASYQVIELTFSDGTEVKVIDEHAFWCFELNEYVYLDENASSYVGYHFNKRDGDSYVSVKLIGVEIYEEVTRAYSPVTYGHLCYYVNGMLSMPGGITGFINIFEVVATELKYDEEAMEEDIATYGLYTYEEFTQEIAEIPKEIFLAFNGQYLKVAIGKGLITEEEILSLIIRYAEFF